MGVFHCSTTALYAVCGDGVDVWCDHAPCAPHPPPFLIPMSYPAGHYSLRLWLWLVVSYSALVHTPVTRSGVFNRAVVRCSLGHCSFPYSSSHYTSLKLPHFPLSPPPSMVYRILQLLYLHTKLPCVIVLNWKGSQVFQLIWFSYLVIHISVQND